MLKGYDKFKFRGKGVIGGIFTGDLIHSAGKTYIRNAITLELTEVKRDSVVQLVGYVPANGGWFEVYEGDEIITRSGEKIYASILRHAKVPPAHRDIDFEKMAKDDGWKLAE